LYGESNASFFKYRISDNRLGRFFSVDPLTSKYLHNSPYAYSENRVIDGVELEGLEYQPNISAWMTNTGEAKVTMQTSNIAAKKYHLLL